MDKKQKMYLNAIAQARLQGKLSVLVGAGVSMNSGYPSWVELAKSSSYLLGSDVDKDPEWIENNLLDYFEQFEILRKKPELKEFISNWFTSISPIENYLHELIFGLQPRTILTTNYDELLEFYDKSHTNSYHVISDNTHTRKLRNARTLVKMHGDFQTGNIVITKTDYEQYSKNYFLVLNQVIDSISDNTLLLIGFSGTDPNINAILINIRKALKDDSPPVYLLSTNINDDFKDVDCIKDKTAMVIHPVELESIDAVVSGDVEKNHHKVQSNKIVSNRGRNISNTLFYIQHAAKIEDEKTKIEQLIKQMKYYKDVKYLLQNHFEAILSNVGIDSYLQYNVWTISSKLYDQIEVIRKASSQRYEEFILSLHSFDIQKIVVRDSTQYIDILTKVESLRRDQDIDTIQETISRFFDYVTVFDYNKVRIEIDKISFQENLQDFKLAILCAQLMQMLGQYKEALEILLKYEEVVKVKGSLWDFVIIQLNLKSIYQAMYRNFLSYRAIEFNKFENIMLKLNSFDIGRHMDNMDHSPPSHFQFFIIDIFNRSTIYWHWSEIKKTTKQIEEDYQTRQEGGLTMHSPLTIELLNYHFQQYDNFTSHNHLPISLWWEDKIVVEEYTKGVLVRYAADNILPSDEQSQSEKWFRIELSELTYDMLIRMVVGNEDKVLSRLIKQYGINDCKVNKNDLEKFVQAFSNLISFTCEFNNNWHLLNTHQSQILNFLTVFSIIPTAITIELWKTILHTIHVFMKKCRIRKKFIIPFHRLIKSIPLPVLTNLNEEFSKLTEHFVKIMLLKHNEELFQEINAVNLLSIMLVKLSKSQENYHLSSKFESFIGERIGDWGPQANNTKTPDFINNILMRIYYFVSDLCQSNIRDFVISRFEIENIDSLIGTYYFYSVNNFIDFTNYPQIKNKFIEAVSEMLKNEDDNLPYGYTKKELIGYMLALGL